MANAQPSRLVLANLADNGGWEDVAQALLNDGPFYRQVVDTVWPLDRNMAIAMAFLEEGKGYALNRPPFYYIDYGGAAWSAVLDGDILHVSIMAPPVDRKTRATGLHFGSIQIAHLGEALLLFIERNRPEIIQKQLQLFLTNTGLRRGFEAAGLDGADFNVESVTVQLSFGDTVESNQIETWVPVQLHVQATVRQKTAVKGSPLSKLSNGALDELIEEIAGPEFVYMDGEIPRSKLPARRAHLRSVYRAYSPRKQTEIWDEYLALKAGH